MSSYGDDLNKLAMLNALHLTSLNRSLSIIDDLASVEFSVFSQWGEDGIIDWIISKIPSIPRTFVEFGVEDYMESNTRLLLQLRNWRGLVMDSSDKNIEKIRSDSLSWRFSLTSCSAFVTCDNINHLLHENNFIGDIGLLSIDIDGNDYWIWNSIDCINPAIVVAEFNAVFGDIYKLSIPYDQYFSRTKYHFSSLYFGASLPSLISLGLEKGYTFIGTNSSGVNAFFVRNDLEHLVTRHMKSISAYPSLHRESRDKNGNLTYIDGINRRDVIRDCPLINVSSGESVSLGTFDCIYSPEWCNSLPRQFNFRN